MTPDPALQRRNRNRIALVLLILFLLAPLIAAIVLSASGWQPQKHRNYGELIEPPQSLEDAVFQLADGSTLAWRDADWSWTIFALPGACAEHCMARLDELRRVRLTLGRKASRARVVVLDPALAPRLAGLEPLITARDVQDRLGGERPAGADQVSVLFADPHGFLVMRFGSDYDADRMRKDLARLVQ